MATATAPGSLSVGPLLRGWRRRRRLSQLDVSARAAISTRHLSFLETGRARPSREMVLHLAEELDVPLRERNTLLVAAGYAPVYKETPLQGDDMTAVRRPSIGCWPAMSLIRRWSSTGTGTWCWPTGRSGCSSTGLPRPCSLHR